MMTIDAIARWIVPGLLNGIWQSALIAVAIAGALHLFRSSASARAVIWLVLLVVTTLLPFLPTQTSLNQSEQVQVQLANDGSQNRDTVRNPAPKIPLTVARIVLLLWVGGAVFQLGRLVVGLVKLFRMKRDAVPLTAREQYPRNARICLSDRCATPVVIGFRRPVVLLPSQLVFSLRPVDLNRILSHEMAHIVRRDDWIQLAQRIVEALFFFHPVILWIGRKLILDREIACDDHVIKKYSESTSYARSLIRLAEMNSVPTAPAAAPAVFSHRNQLSRRIDMLLVFNRNRNVRVSRLGISVLILLVTGLVLFLAQVSPVIAVSAKEKKAAPAERQSTRQAEEELRHATEEMKRTSERMQQTLEQMKRTVDQLNELAERNDVPTPDAVPALIPAPDVHPMPAVPALTPLPDVAPMPAVPSPSVPVLTAPPTSPAPEIAPLPPVHPALPMPRDAKIIDPAPEVPETPKPRKRPQH